MSSPVVLNQQTVAQDLADRDTLIEIVRSKEDFGSDAPADCRGNAETAGVGGQAGTGLVNGGTSKADGPQG